MSATATIPPAHMTIVAPIMMITSPAAASGIRPGRMRRSPGRTRPSAPSTSATPMNLKNQPGSATGPGPLPVNTIGPKVWLTPGSISVAVDRLEKTALVKRKNTDDRRVRLVELTPKGRALITKTFREHAAAMEEAAGVLSKEERLMLLRLLKKLGKGGEDES